MATSGTASNTISSTTPGVGSGKRKNKKVILVFLFLGLVLPGLFFLAFSAVRIIPIATDLGFIKVGGTVGAVMPLVKNSDQFIVGSASGIGKLIVSKKEFQISKEIKEKWENLDAGNGKRIKEDTFYFSCNGMGLVVNENLSVKREDRIGDLTYGDFSLEPAGKIAAFSKSHASNLNFDKPTTVVNFPSMKVIRKFPDERSPLFMDVHEKLHLVTVWGDGTADGEDKIIVRPANDWDSAETYLPEEFVTCLVPGFEKETILVGTKKGQLISLQISPWKEKFKRQVSPEWVTAICVIDEKTIAVGDLNGYLYLMNGETGAVKRLPRNERNTHICCMGYQSSTKTLAVGLWRGRVQLWKLR